MHNLTHQSSARLRSTDPWPHGYSPAIVRQAKGESRIDAIYRHRRMTGWSGRVIVVAG